MTLGKALIPEEIFKFVPALYPHVLEILKRAGLNGPSFLALSYVKHFGKPINGEVACPLSELTGVLVNAGLYETAKNATTLVTALENKSLLRRVRKQKSEVQEHFPEATGYGFLVVLEAEGGARLAAVNAEVQSLFERMTNPATRRIAVVIFRAFRGVASMLITRLELIRRENRSDKVAEQRP